MTDPVLAGDFPQATREDWLRVVEGVLKGAPYDRKLVFQTHEGLKLDALPQRRADVAPLRGRAAGEPWIVCARMDHPDPAAANRLALEDLEGGAAGLSIVFAGAPTAAGYGVAGQTGETLRQALAGISLDFITLSVEPAPFQGRVVAEALAELVAQREHDPATLDIGFGLDPLGDAAFAGGLALPWAELRSRLADTVSLLRGRGFRSPMLRPDGRVQHAAGAGAAQELAAVLASAVEYLRALDDAGTPFEPGLMEFVLAADADQFETIAKFRAARMLWARIAQELGLAPQLRIRGETAWRMMTKRDVHVNLLRTTIAGFAAGVGGADAVTILPFTQPLGLPDGFARRLARNTQTLLIEESNLHRVADPGAGAGAVEAMTEALAQKAWDLFRDIERQGGFAAALAAGSWQAAVQQVAEARAKAVALRREPITGTSEFPLIGEAVPPVLEVEPPAPLSSVPASFPRLAPARTAKPYEALRDAAEAEETRAGKAPAVFLATLGTLAEFTPRATFARNLFAAGGLAGAGGRAYDDAAAMLADFRAVDTELVCLCGTDEAYAAQAAQLAVEFRGLGVTVWLAGRPADEAMLRAAGVSGFIYAGCDALAVLRQAHAVLGIAPAALAVE